MFEVFFDGAHASSAVLAVDVSAPAQTVGFADVSLSIFHVGLAFSGDGPHPNPPPKLSAPPTIAAIDAYPSATPFTTLAFSGDVPHPNPPPPK